MTHSELYTPENRGLVDKWLSGHGYTTWTSLEFPQILREALAKEGIKVEQRRKIYLVKNARCLAESEWDEKGDPTARHALFAATVEYLKGKKSEWIVLDEASDIPKDFWEES